MSPKPVDQILSDSLILDAFAGLKPCHSAEDVPDKTAVVMAVEPKFAQVLKRTIAPA